MEERLTRLAALMLGASALAGCGTETTREERPAAPTTAEIPSNPLRNAYFGDLHLHTSYSFDAVLSDVRTVPDDSYKYAVGEEVIYQGRSVRRKAPLDFLAVTDHAEYLGTVRRAADDNGPFAGTKWQAMFAGADPTKLLSLFGVFSQSGFRAKDPIPEFADPSLIHDSWQDIIAAAQRHYKPGRFTTFVAYEWSFMEGPAHLHRNVIFRGPDYPALPFSATDSTHPEDLWAYAETNRARGIDSLMIPHNSNMSDGLMFSYKDSFNRDMSRAYAEARARNEAAVEISQNKGTSETSPGLSPDDEFAGFELLEREDVRAGNFVRQGLQRGIELRRKLGVNPFKFGIVAGSDFHSGVSASEEYNFPGALGSTDDQSNPRELLTQISPIMRRPVTVLSAAGLTGIWAEKNTREALFDALKRKEVFGTSGPRLRVRLFGGWNLPPNLKDRRDWLEQAYRRGVPMGGDLLPQKRGSARAPGFIVHALKDPDSGNLDRIQIVKLWSENGRTFEKVFNVVWSDARRLDPKTGSLAPVGNTVDVARATYTNSIGATELIGQWTDPNFDPDEDAIYYARVLEIPTPRWPAYLAASNGLMLPEGATGWLQERAWTSPIFYEP